MISYIVKKLYFNNRIIHTVVSNGYSTQKYFKLYSNMKLNETEWQYSLIKSYKVINKLKCIADCSRTYYCKLITHNKFDNTCKYYRYYLTNESSLILSDGDFVYNYKITSSTYNLKGAQMQTIQAGCQVESLITLPDGNLACGCLDGNIKIWNSANWVLIISFIEGATVYSMAILQNKYLVSGGSSQTVKIWDYKTGALIKTYSGHTGNIRVVLILNNDDIVSGSLDKKIKIWDTASVGLKFTLNEVFWIYGLVQIKNGNLVSFCANGNIKIWNPFTGVLLNSITTTDSQPKVTQLNNQDILISNEYHNLRIFDPTTYQFKYTLTGHIAKVNSVNQLQNNDLVSCSDDNYVRVWDWNSKTIKYNLTAFPSKFLSLAELPNGYLAAGTDDSKIIIWK